MVALFACRTKGSGVAQDPPDLLEHEGSQAVFGELVRATLLAPGLGIETALEPQPMSVAFVLIDERRPAVSAPAETRKEPIGSIPTVGPQGVYVEYSLPRLIRDQGLVAAVLIVGLPPSHVTDIVGVMHDLRDNLGTPLPLAGGGANAIVLQALANLHISVPGSASFQDEERPGSGDRVWLQGLIGGHESVTVGGGSTRAVEASQDTADHTRTMALHPDLLLLLGDGCGEDLLQATQPTTATDLGGIDWFLRLAHRVDLATVLSAEGAELGLKGGGAPEAVIALDNHEVGGLSPNQANDLGKLGTVGHNLVEPIILAGVSRNGDLPDDGPAVLLAGSPTIRELLGEGGPILCSLPFGTDGGDDEGAHYCIASNASR